MTCLKIAVAAVLLVSVPAIALAQDAPAKPAPAAKPAAVQAKATPALQARVFVLEHVRPLELVGALMPLASVGDHRMLVHNNSTMTISVRDLPENLLAIESVIRLLDKPSSRASAKRPGPVDVHISVIAASMTELDDRSPAPPELVPVLEQLKRTLSFKYYRYVTTLSQRMRGTGNVAKASGAIASPFPTRSGQERPASYEYRLDGFSGELPDSGPATFGMGFSFQLVTARVTNMPQVQVGAQTEQFERQVLSLETDGLSLKEGEQVVVGSSGAGNGDQSIIVVVSVKRAGA